MPTRKIASPYQAQVLDRALAILEVMAQAPGEISLGQITERLDLHKSTVHRLVRVLERHSLVEQEAETGRYRLGLRLFEFGSRAIARLNLVPKAHALLEKVARQSGETVHLCVLEGSDVLYVDKAEPERSVRMACSVGRRNPAYTTSVGKAMMAHLPESELRAVLAATRFRALTSNTLSSPSAVIAELENVRRRGYALDNEENEEGVRCVGAPVFNYTGRPHAAISISGPTFRVTVAKVEELAAIVRAAAAELSFQLGYRGAPSPPGSTRDWSEPAGVAG